MKRVFETAECEAKWKVVAWNWEWVICRWTRGPGGFMIQQQQCKRYGLIAIQRHKYWEQTQQSLGYQVTAILGAEYVSYSAILCLHSAERLEQPPSWNHILHITSNLERRLKTHLAYTVWGLSQCSCQYECSLKSCSHWRQSRSRQNEYSVRYR